MEHLSEKPPGHPQVEHIIEQEHDKTNKMTCQAVCSKDSAQPGHPLCLICLRCPSEDGFGPKLPKKCTGKTDQTGQMPKLIWFFAEHTGHLFGFVLLSQISHMAPPLAEWSNIVSNALNCSASHHSGIQPCSGYVRQAKFCLQKVRCIFFFLRKLAYLMIGFGL